MASMSRSLNSSHVNRPSWWSAMVTPKARLSHGSANTSSPVERGGDDGPSTSSSTGRSGGRSGRPVDVMPCRRSAGRGDVGATDHRVARDERGEVLLGEALGPGRTLGEDEVAHLGAAVPDLDLDALVQVQAQLGQ